MPAWVQSGTASAPSADTDGMPLTGVCGLTFWLDAGAGQTITADTGQLDVYQRDSDLWGIAPGLVLQVPPGSSGLRRVQVGTVRVDNPRGRIAVATNAVPWSGASGTVEILATTSSHLGPVPA